MDKKVVLKPEKEKIIARRHPWIFSGAIASLPPIQDGEILPVHSQSGEFLAQAYFHSKNSIAGRILSFDRRPIKEVIYEKIKKAYAWRQQLFQNSATNAFRLINSEGDDLPGLVVDSYAGVLAVQINTCGMESLKPLIVEALAAIVQPKAIYEKSSSSARRMEGLADAQGWLCGEEIPTVEIQENGLRFIVSLTDGQKTGFFLDQREMRRLLGSFCQDKKVLNCFSYSAAFSIFALKCGAKEVISVDSCPRANKLAEKNTLLNGFSQESHKIIKADVFDYLRQNQLPADIVILDPPAFVKKRSELDSACRGYKEINRLAFERMPAHSLLLTCSCSYYVDEKLFQNLIFQAATEAGRNVKIVARHLQALDHPISLNHPEGEYLKSLFLLID